MRSARTARFRVPFAINPSHQAASVPSECRRLDAARWRRSASRRPAANQRVTVKIREDFGQYALDRPLLELKFVAQQPMLASQLASLAQPLSADSLALDLTVSGSAKDGGTIDFAVSGVKLNLSIRPFQVAQTILNSLTDGATYEAQLTLLFGTKGRTGTLDALTRLANDAPDGISIEATFGAPATEISA